MMQARGLLAATFALALLAAGVWYSNREEAKKEAAPKADAGPKVVAIPMAELSEVSIERAGSRVRIEHAGDAYSIVEPAKVAADAEAVTSLFMQITALNAERVVDEKPTDLAQFGLNPAQATVTVVRKNGSPVKLLLGEASPTGSSTYAKLDGEAGVFTLSQAVAGSLDKSFLDLRDKRLLPFDRASLTHLVVAGKGSADITPAKSAWKVDGARADGSAVDQLLGALEQARMNPATASDPVGMADAAKAWSTAVPVATVRATDTKGTQTIEVRRIKTKEKDLTYIKSSAMEGIHGGTTELAEALAKPTAEYKNLRVFDFGFDDPTQVEIKGMNLNRALTQADGKWTEAGKTIDSVGAQSLVDKLRDLKATRVATQGGGAAELELNVVSSSGQRVERVTVARHGTEFVASRQGEPEYYALPAQTVNELRQAAADVKEAAKTPAPAPQKNKK